MKKNSDLRSYITQGLLIVFSVLFALFVGKMAESNKINKQKRHLVESLRKEMKTNKETIERWLPKQKIILKSIEDTNSENIYDEGNDDFIFDAFLRKSAWETTKITGIVSELDIESLQKLSDVYIMQEVISNETIKEVTKVSFDEKYQKPENLNDAVIKLKISLEALILQEEVLLELYDRALEKLKNNV